MIRHLFSSQIRTNIVSGVVTAVINTGVLAAAYPMYLYFLGYEQYGVWLVLATVLTFAQLGDIGISQAVTKLVAEDYARNDIQGIQRYVTTALSMLCISGTFALALILLLKIQIIALFRLSDENAKMALWLLPYIGILSIYVFIVQTLNAILSGLGRMDLANYVQSIGRGVSVAVAGLLLIGGFGIQSLLISSVALYVFIHIASLVCIWRIIPLRFLQLNSVDVYRCKRLLHFGGTAFGCSLLSMFLSPFNKVMLSRYAGIPTVPVYEIAYNGSMQIRSLIETGLRALMPEISRIGVYKTLQVKNRISALNRQAMKFIFFFGVPIYAVLILLAPLLLKVWLREQFTDILPDAMRIMLLGTFLSLLCVPAYYTLMGLGRMRYCFLSQVIQGLVNAGVVCLILLATGKVSIYTVLWAVLTAMGVTSVYVNLQSLHTLRQFLHVPASQNSAAVAALSAVSCIHPED
jgi:O-antigen/teichoic acid export membrane protein